MIRPAPAAFLLLLASACGTEPQNMAAEKQPPQPSGPPVVQQAERNLQE